MDHDLQLNLLTLLRKDADDIPKKKKFHSEQNDPEMRECQMVPKLAIWKSIE